MPAPITTDGPTGTARRFAWFVGLWAVSAAVTVAVAYGLRLIIFASG